MKPQTFLEVLFSGEDLWGARLFFLKGVLWSKQYCGTPTRSSWGLKRGFMTPPTASSLDHHLLTVPWVWTLLGSHFLIFASYGILRAWGFSNPEIPGFFVISSPSHNLSLLLHFTKSNKKNLVSSTTCLEISSVHLTHTVLSHYCRW